MIRRIFLMVALLGASGAAHAQAQPAPGQPAPGQPSSEGSQNPYNSGEAEFRDYESERNYVSRAMRDRSGKAPAARSGTAAAAPSDIAPGSQVRDKKGKLVGVVESVDADGAVVSTGPSRVKVPLDAFGKKESGLMLGITKAQFDALVADATATPAG